MSELYIFSYAALVVIAFLSTINDFGNVAITPKQIYECNDLNMFGCVVVFIVSFLFNPLFYIVHFIYWIFHVGRKE